jgi:hypothetical protein
MGFCRRRRPSPTRPLPRRRRLGGTGIAEGGSGAPTGDWLNSLTNQLPVELKVMTDPATKVVPFQSSQSTLTGLFNDDVAVVVNQ